MLLVNSVSKVYCCVLYWILSMSTCSLGFIADIDRGLLEFVRPEILSITNDSFKWSSVGGQSKTILLYTALFGKHEWPNFKLPEGDVLLKKYGCPVTNCILRYNTGERSLKNASIVIFHDRDMPDVYQLRNLVRPKDQIWVYFTGENPLHSHLDLTYLDDIFNWTMTYKHDSDIWVPYFRYFPKRNQKTEPNVSFVRKKKKLVAWLASNCGLMRERVVHELQQLLPVHVGGHCSSFYRDKLECASTEDCDKKISDYKFYLAFENQLCDEYVTEKYWYRAIKNNVVPIVLGGSSYRDPRVAIPGSYINVLDFSNIDMLVKYIKYLDSNHTAYNEYFRWKDVYSLWEPLCDWPFEPYWACQMCMRLHKGIRRSKKVKLSKYWSSSSSCTGYQSNLQIFLENSGHNFQVFDERRRAAENPYKGIGRELDYEEMKMDKRNGDADILDDPEDGSEKLVDGDEADAMLLLENGVLENVEYNILLLCSLAVIGFILFAFNVRIRGYA